MREHKSMTLEITSGDGTKHCIKIDTIEGGVPDVVVQGDKSLLQRRLTLMVQLAVNALSKYD